MKFHIFLMKNHQNLKINFDTHNTICNLKIIISIVCPVDWACKISTEMFGGSSGWEDFTWDF